MNVNNRVCWGESDRKSDNQLIPYTDWLKRYPHVIFIKAGTLPTLLIVKK
jgi:hypothetical protein